MKAVRLHEKRDLRFEDVPLAKMPEDGEVRVRVSYAGICGSDIHNFKTGQWITRKPSIAGHEFSGVIDSIGGDHPTLRVGDHVIADSRFYCGDCDNCQASRQHLCASLGFVGEAIDGGFAEYITLPARLVLVCNPDLDLSVAALAEPLAVALHALARAGVSRGDSVLIVGCGPIGALCAVASRILYGTKLLVSDIDASRQAHVVALTCAQSVELKSFDQFKNPTGHDVHHVIDTTGNITVISQLVARLHGASLALVGIGSGTFALDPVELVEREISLVGCHAFSNELEQAVRMLQGNPESFMGLIGPVISLEQTPAAYDKIAAGQAEGIKTLIKISTEAGAQ